MKVSKLIKSLVVVFAFFVIFLISNKVYANSIESISMDIYINNNGTANITETWNCTSSEGTEVYRPYYNLGNSKITNLSVSADNTPFATLDRWDVDASFSGKAYKSGINYIPDGVEICWGISSYGKHSYVVSYDITNFVSELTDSQMMYWTLIPHDLSNNVGSVSIKIYSDIAFPQTIDVWGYGQYGAPCYVSPDGYIAMASNGTLHSNEYLTILAKFPLGTFNLSNKLNNDFQYFLDMAEYGTDKYVPDSSYQGDGYYINHSYSFESFVGVFSFIAVAFAAFGIIIGAVAVQNTSSLDFGEAGKNLPSDVPYFRDIPCRGDIFRAYFIADSYSLIKNKTNLFGAILLKWLKEDKIKIEKRTMGKIIKKEENCIILDSSFTSDRQPEQDLYNNLYEASKSGVVSTYGVLEPNEFKKWCSKHYDKILKWFDDVLKYERDRLVLERKLTEIDSGKMLKIKKYAVDSSLKDEAIELKGLRRFLKDFTAIKEREPKEVTLFEEYLMLAQMFGIAKEVAKAFEKIYPNLIEERNYNYSYADALFVTSFAYMAVASATSAQSAANSYSGGGGGFSSGGGRWRLIRWPEAADGGFR